MLVTVTRRSNRYLRSINGAWLGDAPSFDTRADVPLESLPHWTIGDSSLRVVFPDGTEEQVLASSQPFPGYPPSVIGARLQAEFTKAGVKFHAF